MRLTAIQNEIWIGVGLIRELSSKTVQVEFCGDAASHPAQLLIHCGSTSFEWFELDRLHRRGFKMNLERSQLKECGIDWAKDLPFGYRSIGLKYRLSEKKLCFNWRVTMETAHLHTMILFTAFCRVTVPQFSRRTCWPFNPQHVLWSEG